MVLPLDSDVVGGVQVENQELLAKCGGLEEMHQAVAGRASTELVEEKPERGVDEEGEGYDGVLNVGETICSIGEELH